MLYRKNNLDASMSELYQANDADPATAYDGLDRLTAFARGTLSTDDRSITYPSVTKSWNLDGQDNWASVTTDSTIETRDHNAANETTAVGSTSLTYDAAGNLTNDGTYTYTFDGWNRLVAVHLVSNSSQVATYSYDGQGHRTSKTVGSTTAEYYYDSSWRVVEERQGGNVTAQYVYGMQWPDVPIARIAGSQTLFYCTDAMGKVTSVVDASTGQVAERYVYDPYGAVTFLKADWSLQDGDTQHAAGTVSAVGNEVLYAGYRYDAETGLYNLRNREYHPTLGQFLERDPSGYGISAMNLYGYAHDQPITNADPMGLCDDSAQKVPRDKDAEKDKIREKERQLGMLVYDLDAMVRQRNAVDDLLYSQLSEIGRQVASIVTGADIGVRVTLALIARAYITRGQASQAHDYHMQQATDLALRGALDTAQGAWGLRGIREWTPRDVLIDRELPGQQLMEGLTELQDAIQHYRQAEFAGNLVQVSDDFISQYRDQLSGRFRDAADLLGQGQDLVGQATSNRAYFDNIISRDEQNIQSIENDIREERRRDSVQAQQGEIDRARRTGMAPMPPGHIAVPPTPVRPQPRPPQPIFFGPPMPPPGYVWPEP